METRLSKGDGMHENRRSVPTHRASTARPDERGMQSAQLRHQVLASNSVQTAQLNAYACMMHGKAALVQRVGDEELLSEKLDSVQKQQAGLSLKGLLDHTPVQIGAPAVPVQRAEKTNPTGLPSQLKSDIELLKGTSMDNVKAHYHSDTPTQLQAHADPQHSENNVGHCQQKNFPREAWHVVQKAHGRVMPTKQLKSGVAISDDKSLQYDADVMGQQAMLMQRKAGASTMADGQTGGGVAQLAKLYKKKVYGLPHWEVTFLWNEKADPENPGKPVLWQVGFSNPTASSDTSSSALTKPGSPSGYGGEGEVHWEELRKGTVVKGGYTLVEETATDDQDNDLAAALLKKGEHSKYRLTSRNCQHFIADAWLKAGLQPDIREHLTLSAERGDDVNNSLLGAAGATATLLMGGVLLGAAPVLGLLALGAGAGAAAGFHVGRARRSKKEERQQ